MTSINSFIFSSKFAHRILYSFYNNNSYAKLSLPEQQTVLNSLVTWANKYNNRNVFIKTLKEIWKDKLTYHKINAQKKYIEMDETLGIFHDAVKLNKPLIVKNVSGIWNPSKNALDDDEMIVEILLKNTINLFHGVPILYNEDLIPRADKTLCPASFMDNDYQFPLDQHCLNSILVFNRFDPKEISKINENINYNFYLNELSNVPLIIESHVVKYTLKSYLSLAKNSKFFFQTPDNPLGDHTQYSSVAYAQMKQPHPDVREDGFTIEPYHKFFDVKLYSDPIDKLSLSRGHLSLTTCLNDEKKMRLMKRATGDYKGSIKQKLDNKQISESEYDYMVAKLEVFSEIIKEKNVSVTNKWEKFLQMQHKINSDPKMSLVCSYIAQPPNDLDYDTFHHNFLQGKFNKALIVKKLQAEKHLLIPTQGQYVDRIAWDRMIRYIIKNLPENIRVNVEENYERVKSLEL